MPMLSTTLACLAMAAGPADGATAPKDAPKAPSYKVLQVADGDTVVVKMGETVRKVRLLGVDPPPVAPGEKEASRALRTEFLKELLKDDSVTLSDESGDRLDPQKPLLANVRRASD